MTNIAFIGCAHIHTPNFIQMSKLRDDVKIKYVWDHDADRAAKRATDAGGQAIKDLKAVLSDPDVSAVVICSETVRHMDLVMQAAEAKKNLFVEKPLGMAAKDAWTMAAAIEKAGVIFNTGYFNRGRNFHLFLKEQVEKGSFGKITRVRHQTCHNGALGGWFDTEWKWMTDPAQSGVGAFGDLGTHSLDILIWLMGDVESCTASLNVGTKRYGCDELGEGLLRFKNGAIGTVAASWDDTASPVTAMIAGTEGHAVVVNDRVFFQSSKVEGADGKNPWNKLPKGKPHAFDLYLDAITGAKDVPLVTPREAAYRSAVMEALYEGANHNNWESPRTM